MSLWAKNMNGDKVIIENNGVSKGSTEDEFLCPSCGQPMWFNSQSSNMRGAHFKGHHKDGCDIGFITENENAYKYNLSKKSLYDLLQSLIKDGIKPQLLEHIESLEMGKVLNLQKQLKKR